MISCISFSVCTAGFCFVLGCVCVSIRCTDVLMGAMYYCVISAKAWVRAMEIGDTLADIKCHLSLPVASSFIGVSFFFVFVFVC